MKLDSEMAISIPRAFRRATGQTGTLLKNVQRTHWETSPIRYQTLLTVTKHYLLAYTCFSFAEPSFKSLPTIELDSEIPILILRAFLWATSQGYTLEPMWTPQVPQGGPKGARI